MIRYLTAGESHGPGLALIVEGVPAGLTLTKAMIHESMQARKQGYGRGGRQKIETDEVQIWSGIRFGKTIGSPIAMTLANKDYVNWHSVMPIEDPPDEKYQPIRVPRPGHADFAGVQKYQTDDIRNILERSSARETAMRVAAGSIAKAFLSELGIEVFGFVSNIGGVSIDRPEASLRELKERALKSKVRTPDVKAEKAMVERIDEAGKYGVSLGGQIKVLTTPLPIGLGSHVQWDRKIDARLAMAVMSIQAIKAISFGAGEELACATGSDAQDAFIVKDESISRATNHAGGIEGGMTNGMPLVINATMKPIPTTKIPLDSVDLDSKEVVPSFFERADVCAVPAASVIAEHVVAIELANALLDKFGGDSVNEIAARVKLS